MIYAITLAAILAHAAPKTSANESALPTLPTPFRGIVVPLVTPFDAAGDLDEPSFQRLIDFVLEGGVKGLMVLGTTGEGPALGRELQETVIRAAVRLAKGRAPVLVNVSATALADSIRLARVAEAAGAAGVVLSPPSYFPLSQEEMLVMVQGVSGASSRPLFLYDIPSMVHQDYDGATLRAAARLPNVVGVKDSSGDRGQLRDWLAFRSVTPDFAVLVGEEGLLAEGYVRGATGGVSGSANVRPKLFTGLHDAVEAKDELRIARAAADIADWKAWLKQTSKAPNASIAIFKTALKAKGIISDDRMCEPFMGLDDEARARVIEAVSRWPRDGE